MSSTDDDDDDYYDYDEDDDYDDDDYYDEDYEKDYDAAVSSRFVSAQRPRRQFLYKCWHQHCQNHPKDLDMPQTLHHRQPIRRVAVAEVIHYRLGRWVQSFELYP